MNEQERVVRAVIPGGLTGRAWQRRAEALRTGVCPGHVWQDWHNVENGVTGIGCTACGTMKLNEERDEALAPCDVENEREQP